MRKIILLISCIMIFTISAYSADIVVKNIIQLTKSDDGAFYYPCFSPDGGKIFFTGSNFKGLLFYDLDHKEIVQLNDDPGAGYQPVFTPDGGTVYYRTYNYINRRKYSSLIEQNIAGGQKNVLLSNKRNLSTPRLNLSGNLVFLDKSEIEKISVLPAIKSDKLNVNQIGNPEVFIDNTDIVLVQDGKRTVMEPVGPGNYIWPSVSPAGDRLLFTKVGEGTYITDLNGENALSLGMANAPKWSPDGDWVLYMVDKDDGYMVLESDLYVIRSDAGRMIKLTDTSDRIEMYPVWSDDMTRIAFATDQGEIFLIELESE